MSDETDRAERLASMREAMENGRKMMELIQPIIVAFPACLNFLTNAYKTTIAADAADADCAKAVQAKADAEAEAVTMQKMADEKFAALNDQHAAMLREMDAKRQSILQEHQDLMVSMTAEKDGLQAQIVSLKQEADARRAQIAMSEADVLKQHQAQMDTLTAERDEVKGQIETFQNELAALKARLG
jgi:chromosome segregation ATPase